MHVRRKTFLNEHCHVCGGKVVRVLMGGRVAADDRGDEYCCTQLLDCCEECSRLLGSTAVINWPCEQLDTAFDNWERHQVSREAFDQQVSAVLQLAGVVWQLKQA